MTVSYIALAGLFITAGIGHFVRTRWFAKIMPVIIPKAWHVPLVYVSGVFEILGGIGMLIEPVRYWAGIGLLALLVCVFPANVQMLITARQKRAPRGEELALWLRLPVQGALLWWVWQAAVA